MIFGRICYVLPMGRRFYSTQLVAWSLGLFQTEPSLGIVASSQCLEDLDGILIPLTTDDCWNSRFHVLYFTFSPDWNVRAYGRGFQGRVCLGTIERVCHTWRHCPVASIYMKTLLLGCGAEASDNSVSKKDISRESFNARLGMLQPQSRFSRPKNSGCRLFKLSLEVRLVMRMEHKPRMCKVVELAIGEASRSSNRTILFLSYPLSADISSYHSKPQNLSPKTVLCMHSAAMLYICFNP